MPDLVQMQTLVVVTDLGSLVAAARKLKISAAAVSKQITRLEDELGLHLFHRTTRLVELTEIGRLYCEQCRSVLAEAELAAALISNIKIEPHGVLKVVSGRHFGITFILPHLKELFTKYPKIELNLELAERIPMPENESIDVLIGMSISVSGNMIQKKIMETRYVLCASGEYLKQNGMPKKPRDLAALHYITHSMRHPDNEIMFKNNETVKLTPFMRLNDTESMLKVALDGLGIVMLHSYVVEDYLKNGRLIEILPSEMKSSVPLYVAFPQRRYINAKVRHFVDFIESKIVNAR